MRPATKQQREPALEGEPLELLEFLCKREAARAESFTGLVTYVIMVLTHSAGGMRWQRRHLHPDCLAKQPPFTITESSEHTSWPGQATTMWTHTRDPTEVERLQHAFSHPHTPLRDVQKSGNQLCHCCQRPFKSNPYTFDRSDRREHRGRSNWKDLPFKKR